MNKLLVSVMSAAMLAVSGVAYADDSAYPNNYSPNEYHPDVNARAPEHVPFKLGLDWDIGIPSGMALGLETRLPHLPWFKLGLDATYTLAPGIRGNLLIDPIKFPVVPVLNLDVGRQFPFTVPVNGRPGGDFDYVDFQAGLAFGSRDGARLLLLAGESYISGSSHNIQAVFGDSNGLTIANPTFKGFIPDAKLGVEFLF
jgi:hypothetical protein